MLNPIQLVRELPIVGGDVRKVGYFTGIIVRLFTLFFSRRTHQIGVIGIRPSRRGGGHLDLLEPPF